MHNELNAERLRELLSYDPETGVFTWAVRPSQRVMAGSIAGAAHKSGYRYIKIMGRSYFAHRLAWLYVHGEWPANEVDHVDGDPLNNALSNLRSATRAENMQNFSRARADSKSGFRGVTWNSQYRKWEANITHRGRQRRVGFFDTAESAHNAYLAAKAELHPFAPKLAA